MKKKRILWVVGGLVALLCVVVVVVAFSLGSIVKKGVETVGPTATKVDVKLKGAEFWLLAWRVQLNGFFLGNPSGCKTPSAIEVDHVSVQVKPGSAFADKLVVKSIEVKKPVITLEGGLKNNNLTTIEKNLDEYIGSGSTTPNPSPSSTSSQANHEKKLQVDDLVISGAKLRVNTTFSAGRTITLSIPDIHLTNLGDGPDGITPVEVSQRALHAILAAATEEVAKNASKLGSEALSESKGEIQKAGDKLKSLFH